MEKQRTDIPRKRQRVAQALLIGAALFALSLSHWALDTQDIIVEWTEAGKQLAQERVAKWRTKDEMVLIPAGEFVMGSDKKKDRLAYRSEIPQRSVYLDPYLNRQIRSHGAGVSQIRAGHRSVAPAGLAL